MKRTAIFIFLIVAVIIAVGVVVKEATSHLTATPPQKVKLTKGINELSFPVVRAHYLLRVGREDLKPARFPFSVKGVVQTPTERITLDEVYQPNEDVISQKVSGGCISRVIAVSAKRGNVSVQLFVSFPEKENLTCTFQGIK